MSFRSATSSGLLPLINDTRLSAVLKAGLETPTSVKYRELDGLQKIGWDTQMKDSMPFGSDSPYILPATPVQRQNMAWKCSDIRV